MMSTTPEQKAAYYKSQCLGYGFKDGTPQMAQCMQTEATNTRADATSRVNSINAMNAANQQSSMTCTTLNNITRCNSF